MRTKYRFADRRAAESAVAEAEQLSLLRHRLLVCYVTGDKRQLCRHVAGEWTYTLLTYDEHLKYGPPKYAVVAECAGQSPSILLYADHYEMDRQLRPDRHASLNDETLALHSICNAAGVHNHHWTNAGLDSLVA